MSKTNFVREKEKISWVKWIGNSFLNVLLVIVSWIDCLIQWCYQKFKKLCSRKQNSVDNMDQLMNSNDLEIQTDYILFNKNEPEKEEIRPVEKPHTPRSKFKAYESIINRELKEEFNDSEVNEFDLAVPSSFVPTKNEVAAKPLQRSKSGALYMCKVERNGIEVRLEDTTKAASYVRSVSTSRKKYVVYDLSSMVISIYDNEGQYTNHQSFVCSSLVQTIREGSENQNRLSFFITGLNGLVFKCSANTAKESKEWISFISYSLQFGNPAPLIKGYMKKQGRLNRDFVRRFCVFCTNDLSFSYFESKEDCLNQQGLKGRAYVIEQVQKYTEKHVTYGLQFNSLDNRTYCLAFETLSERDEWYSKMVKSVERSPFMQWSRKNKIDLIDL